MANSVGSLTVLLGLDAAEYTRGLTKAERDAQKFAQNTRAAILEVGKVLGGLEIVRQVMETTKAIIAEAAALDDLSDATGSSVESAVASSPIRPRFPAVISVNCNRSCSSSPRAWLAPMTRAAILAGRWPR